MLFETVYGPELERVYAFISARGAPTAPIARGSLYDAMVPNGGVGHTKNAQDAVAFLRSACLINEDARGLWVEAQDRFRPALLRRLRVIQTNERADALDRLYMTLVEDLFVRPNRLYRTDLHVAANGLDAPPISQERVNAWARVLEYLGLGCRVARGFHCAYTPSLIAELLAQHPPGLYEIDRLLEDILGAYLPVRARDGTIALTLQGALMQLHEDGVARFARLQDSPARPFGADGHTHVQIRSRRRSRRQPVTIGRSLQDEEDARHGHGQDD